MTDDDRAYFYWHSQSVCIRRMKEDVSPTLPAAMGMGGGMNTSPMLIVEKKTMGDKIFDIQDRRRGALESEGASPTLLSRMGTGGNNVPVLIEEMKHGADTNAAERHGGGT